MRLDLYPNRSTGAVAGRRMLIATVFAAFLSIIALARGEQEKPKRWFKGNTHTHSIWSDGDAAPERIVHWYKEHGYNFLVLSDHNLLQNGEKWFPISEDAKSRLTAARVAELKKLFGEAAVVVKKTEKGESMKLATLDELKARFESEGAFRLIPGEEVTDAYGANPVHVNGVNLAEVVAPNHGKSVREVMNANVDAIYAQGERLGRTVMAHINHPNFGWGVHWDDLAAVVRETFFEVYNGHPATHLEGDATHESIEKVWDLVLTTRLVDLHLPPLWAVATDDAHSYFDSGDKYANPGRGWVMVRAAELTPEAIVSAMRRGDYYASSGVTIKDFKKSGGEYRIDIDAEPGVVYKTSFIGTILENKKPAAIGATIEETTANPAIYKFKGDELYVRAVVTSTKLHPNPYKKGDFEKAWLQPALIATVPAKE